MAGSIVAIEDIPPTRSANAIMAVCLLVISLICWVPIVLVLYYDGIGSFLDWPSLFNWLLVIGSLLVGLAIHLLVSRRRIGAEARFHDGGFTVKVRHFLRREWEHRLDWSDIEEMKQVEAPRGGDLIAFRLNRDAALREGLIAPTTREDASKLLVPREVLLPIKLTGVSIATAVARFHQSAEQAGMRLDEVTSFNVVVFVRRIWKVERA